MSLQDLVFLGRHQKEVDIFGHKVVLKTLNQKEQREVLDTVASNNLDVSKLLDMRIESLCRAIVSVDGELNVDYNKTREMLKEMTEPVIAQLWKNLEDVIKEKEEMLKDKESMQNLSQTPIAGQSGK